MTARTPATPGGAGLYHWRMASPAPTRFQTGPAPGGDAAAIDAAAPEGGDALVEEDLLVEEISIDGMCGVY